MKTPKTSTLVLLALLTGGAVLGWRQYQELVQLRAAALTQDERSDLQKRLWDLDRLNKQLGDQLAAARSAGRGDVAAGPRPPGDNPDGRGGRGGPGRGGPGGPNSPEQRIEALRGMLAKPEVQALLSLQQKATIENRYAALFKNLNLSPEQRAKFESLLTNFQATRLDVMTAAQEQGVNDPAGVRKLMGDAQTDLNNSLKSLLGDAGFAQYQSYDQTVPQRNVVSQLQQRLSSTDTPLTPAQADQLIQILAANPPPRPPPPNGPQGQGGGRPAADAPRPGVDFGNGIGSILAPLIGGEAGNNIAAFISGGRGGGGGAPAGGPVAAVTPAAVNQAQGVLSQPQLAALTQIQQQQQTQQQLQQIVRETISAAQPPGGPGGRGGDGRRGGGGG